MKILFISNDLIAGNLAKLLVKEGHEVKIYIHEKARRENLENIVPKTENWKKELSWVGKDGLIVFDDTGWGKEQTYLRKNGYTVFGGSQKGDELEFSREYTQDIFKKYGLKTKETKDFNTIEEAILYIENNPKAWVIKQNDHAPKAMNYVGHFKDGKDTIAVLKSYLTNPKLKKERVTLQERIYGIEVGVGRYFNGSDWVGPIEINVEHKKFFPGDIGPTTSEMGTLAWYSKNENNRLFKEVLSPLKNYLKEIDFRGDFEINCIVNEQGPFPLEVTPRFGSPIVHLHSELHISPWGEFLYAIASGKKYNLKWKKGYGIVILLAVPPFPYTKKEVHNSSKGIRVFFHEIKKEDFSHIHLEEISKEKDSEQLYISDDRGYIMYATNTGKTIKNAVKNTYEIVDKIVIPKMIYRNDIGERFLKNDYKILKKLGYVN